MEATASTALKLPEIEEAPYQPMQFDFPKRDFGKMKVVSRTFQSSWFGRWRWLHYDAARDLAFCHTCVYALKTGKMKVTGNARDSAFLYGGYSNWKDATVSFGNHEKTSTHKTAVDVTLPATSRNVGEMLASSYAVEKAANRHCLMVIARNIRFLSRQGIALRGDGDEKDSNFMQLLLLRAEDDPQILPWLERKTNKYTSPEIQNELLGIMAKAVVRDIAASIKQAKFYTLMADEVTDVSNKEQVAICLRSVDEGLEAHEDFIGLHYVDSIKADTLVAVLKDVLLRLGLPLGDCRGQCYDGAANMAGAKSGVATQILQEEPRATFTHCYGHALNLAAGDTIKKNKILRNALDTTFEISKLLKYSPRRDAIFHRIKAEVAPDTPSFRTLCPTRWTVRASSLQSVLDNYHVLQELWEEAIEIVGDSEVRARIGGTSAAMATFDYLFGITLGQLLLQHSDNLSKTLQNPLLMASEAQEIAALTCKTLERMRNDESFDLFWQKVLRLQQQHGVREPELPRKRKAPARYEVGAGQGQHPSTVVEVYRPIYFECLDHVISCIQDRFDQPGYVVLRQLEDLLLKAAKGECFNQEMESVMQQYKNDFTRSSFAAQLELLPAALQHQDQPITLALVRTYFKSLSPAQRSNFSEICTLLKLIIVTPATNAISERSASALRRIKTYLRSTMSQARLNHLLLLHTHKGRTDGLHLASCLQEFVDGRERRSDVFGKF